jgi:hypothetical protein
MSHPPKYIYEFVPYRLDPAERLLRRDGEAVPLQPQVFDLLLVLVERHGRPLERRSTGLEESQQPSSESRNHPFGSTRHRHPPTPERAPAYSLLLAQGGG